MLRGELTSLGDDGRYVVEVDFGTEGGTRKVPAHIEMDVPRGGFNTMSVQMSGGKTVPDDMPGFTFYETMTGWVAARHRE
jgi:hypothetical protein